MRIETVFRGYKVHYSENRDNWACHDLDVEAATLSKLKEKINAVLLKSRKASSIELLYLESTHSGGEAILCKAIDHKSKKDSRRIDGDLKVFDRHSIGVMLTRRGNERASKQWVAIGDLYLDTPENLQAIQIYQNALRAAKRAREEADRARKRIDCVTIEDLQDLIRACHPESPEE